MTGRSDERERRTMRLAVASEDSEPDGHPEHRGKELL
jgi:hypothetical protein